MKIELIDGGTPGMSLTAWAGSQPRRPEIRTSAERSMPHLASLPKVLLTFIVIILICCLPEDVGRDDATT
jgi:hypothetical protein